MKKELEAIVSQKAICLVLAVLCFLVYSNSFHNQFISDDIPGILNNPAIRQPLKFLFYPDTVLSSLNYLIGQDNPFVYHLTNTLLHAASTILVFLFLKSLFLLEAAFLGAAVFAVHPVHVEAVAWISGRPYPILAIVLLGVYLFFRKALEDTFKVRYYVASLLLFLYFSVKQFTLAPYIPVFLIVADVSFSKDWRCHWKWWIPFISIAAVRLLLAYFSIVQRIQSVAQDTGGGFANPLFNMAYSFFAHAGLLLFPAKLTLYHEPAIISQWALNLELVGLGVCLVLLPFLFRKARRLFFALVLLIIFLAPTYSPVQISWLVAERYLYVPVLSLGMLWAYGYERLAKKLSAKKKILVMIGIFVIASYSVRTVSRNEDWKTPGRFWRQTVEVSPVSPRAHNNMGDVYSREGNSAGAEFSFKRAIELKPDYAEAYHNLANIYQHQSRFIEAAQMYKNAISFKPGLFESQYNLGLIYLAQQELDLAMEQFNKSLQLRPADANARKALSLVVRKKQEMR
ncbi:MAG: tetratricopeptide repeat protein [Candidatus Omnitrophica bacterium]|nr:tetratricopeptide repeat protein [Candidatus Omnitrophota bacterium]